MEPKDFAITQKQGDSPSDKSKIPRIIRTRSAGQRLVDAASQPPIVMLFGVFFHSGELAILFADTGVGKSICAVGVGNAIAAGQSYLGMLNQAQAQVVLYYDYELSDKQFQKRYSDDSGNLYEFNSNLQFADTSNEIYDPSCKIPFEKILFNNIGRDIEETNAKVIVLDNLTFLTTQALQKQDVAMEIMKQLKSLKDKYGISILVIAHTPKIDNWTAINLSHLSGSKQLSNFADSVFSIGKSCVNPNYRYFKQVKVRNSEMIYGADNVIIVELIKKGSFLTFEFIGYEPEWKHLDKKPDAKKDLKSQAVTLYNEGKNYVEIAAIVGKGKSTIGRWLQDIAPSPFLTPVSDICQN
jgi:hypothetical protein